MNIALYIGSWPQNIGNAFFDLGLEAIIRKAIPTANIVYTGGAVHWMFNHPREKQKTFFGFKPAAKSYLQNSFEIAQYANVDLVVVPGMCIAKEFVDNNGKTFLELAKRDIPVLFIGAGALEYTPDEAAYYVAFLNTFHKYGIITRDSNTHDKLYEAGATNMQKGIDCAFFLPDRYTPPTLSLPKFNVVNFDATDENSIAIDHGTHLIVRTHHDCWGPLPEKYMDRENTLVSDVPFDYLTLYANVHETYSDRVHACVASLTYGNKARLFSDTPRAALFREVGAEKITREVTAVDMQLLNTRKDQQIVSVQKMIADIL